MKIKNYFFIAIAATSTFLVNPLVQAIDWSKPTTSDYPYCYLQQYSWLGLILNEITYGPITIRDVQLNNRGDQLVIVKPGEIVEGQLRYRVDSTDQEISHRYHLVVGLNGVGAQECVTHAWGINNSGGKGHFTLKAPLEPGLYEIRFICHEASNCEEAHSAWNNQMGDPSNFATIGAILVE